MKSASIIIFIVLLPLCALVISFVAGAMISGIVYKKETRCYVSNVQECLDCHNKNLTYLLCSGFCAPPEDNDLSYPGNENPTGSFCSVHPSENCFDSIPQECLT